MSPKVVVVNELLDRLPIGEVLEWKAFEQFCTDVLASRMNIVNAREYLQQGNDQDGIDIYATESGTNALTVAQCKLKAYISPQELEQIIDLFLTGKFKDKAKEFIFCTNYDLTKLKDEELIDTLRDKLAKLGIDLIIWDWRGISAYLRQAPQPHIVARYFDVEIAKAFYGAVYEESLQQYLKIPKLNYTADKDHIDRRVITHAGFLQNIEKSFHYRTDKNQYLSLTDEFKKHAGAQGLKIILLSTAGFGKTWEMENVAAYFSNKDEPLFPVMNCLKDYEGQTIPEILAIFNKDWARIPEESLILIFDGLDEVKDEHHQTFINHLNQFCGARQRTNVIVSTRYNFYNISAVPLRSFQPFVLDPFDESDVDFYINKKLGSGKLIFREKVEQSDFVEYLQNPYYLTRLVSLFADGLETFPHNKATMFEQILFERFKRDKDKYHITEDKDLLFKLAQKIAFCMTMLGKSSLDEAEMGKVLDKEDYIKLFKHFFLMNKEGNLSGNWSFEHKNLQEYLCASFLLGNEFKSILPLVSFNHEKPKLQPRFLNTFSFLFAIEEPSSDYFRDLLEWLNNNEPELLVRFERDKVSKLVRKDIFQRIISYYNDRNIMLFASSNFRVNELADFVEIDGETIGYIDSLLLANPREWLAKDLIELLSECRKGFIYEAKLRVILWREFNRTPISENYIQRIIEAYEALKFFEPSDVSGIMGALGNTESFSIRKALVSYLSEAGVADSYPNFILKSILIYEKGQQSINELFADERLKMVILSLKTADSLIKILNYGARNRDFIGLDGSDEFKLEAKEMAEILSKALLVYPSNPRILGAVYKLFRTLNFVSIYSDWLTPFRKFFAATCGLNCIFQKIYKYEKYNHDLMAIAEEESCEFLIDEYKAGKIKFEQMRTHRNTSGFNKGLHEKFTQRLTEEFGSTFDEPTDNFNFQANTALYDTKNQQLLIEKELFVEELEAIFKHSGKEVVTAKDLYSDAGYYHNPFTPSIAFMEIRKNARKIPITVSEMISFYQTDDQWETFKINQIMRMLENRKKKEIAIEPKLIDFATEWAKANIENLDYVNAVRDNGTGGANFNRLVEFTNRLFLILQFDLSDTSLLKLLLSDFRGGFRGETSITKVVLEKITDKDLLKETVLQNIKNGPSTWVLLNHFSICEQLRYKECLPELYKAIISHPVFTEHDKTRLADFYLSLGGDIEDFSSVLTVPDPAADEHGIFWTWYLVKNLLPKRPDLILPILEQIMAGPSFTERHKLLACELLLSVKKIEGLEFWLNYLKNNNKVPFNYRQDPIMTNCVEMPFEQTIPIFIEALDFAYTTGLDKTLAFPDSATGAAYNALTAISKISVQAFNKTAQELEFLIQKHKNEDFTTDISYYRELIINGYYQSDHRHLSLDDVLVCYQGMPAIV